MGKLKHTPPEDAGKGTAFQAIFPVRREAAKADG